MDSSADAVALMSIINNTTSVEWTWKCRAKCKRMASPTFDPGSGSRCWLAADALRQRWLAEFSSTRLLRQDEFSSRGQLQAIILPFMTDHDQLSAAEQLAARDRARCSRVSLHRLWTALVRPVRHHALLVAVSVVAVLATRAKLRQQLCSCTGPVRRCCRRIDRETILVVMRDTKARRCGTREQPVGSLLATRVCAFLRASRAY